MSRRPRDLALDAPQTAEDRVLAKSQVRRMATLLAMLPGPQSIDQLIKAVCMPTHMTSSQRFTREVLDPLRELGLVEPGPATKRVREQLWELTPAGRREARREAQARATQAERDAADQWAVAGRREHLYAHQPLPAGEFRVMRPGAYEHEAWPSRHGDWLHYRDGRVVHISERDAA